MSDRQRKPIRPIEGAFHALPDIPELQKAAERQKRRHHDVVKAEGFGETVGGLAIAQKWLPELAKGIERALASDAYSQVHTEFLAVVRDLPPEVLALCCLQPALNGIARGDTLRDTTINIGMALSGECWAQDLTRHDPDLAKKIEKQLRRNPAYSKRQQQMARVKAERAGYKTNDWKPELLARAGEWAIDQLLTILPDVFTTVDEPQEKYTEKVLVLTEVAEAYAERSIVDVIWRNPVWLPKTERPLPWTNWNKGGTADKRLTLTLRLLQSRNKSTANAVRAAIRDKTMQPALDALNALQSTAWTINNRVLAVLRACAERGIAVPGLPTMASAPLPEKPAEWSSMGKEDRGAWWKEHGDTIKQNRKNRSGRFQLIDDIKTADGLADHERFWTPMHLDLCGRVINLPYFSFHRDDRVRALFLFADGEPIGERGMYWLKVHVANCGDFGKISKRPFDERVKWVDDNLEEIRSVAAGPLRNLWWTKGDAPFQFLAACFELTSALELGPTFISRLPICFDGSCNGLQHLAAMTGDPDTARRVNLTPSELPRDIYQYVADKVKERVERDLESADPKIRGYAEMCLAYGINRKLLKRNVMTYGYGSVVKGMQLQLYEDTMKPASLVSGARPFGDDGGYKASWYLAKHTYAVITDVVRLPAKVMTFLQQLTRTLAKKNKPLRWTTPTGLPFINQYNKPITKQVHLHLHSQGVRIPYTTKLTVGELPDIDRKEAVLGAAPNFVHACDAAHLMLTVNAAVAEGITSIATVHDSFGCLASRAERFRKIIREQFVRMYEEHDVLAEVLESARAELAKPDPAMPSAPPQKGTFDIRKVLGAEFAFA